MTPAAMTVGPEFLVALVAMAAASFACRAGGFVLMRFVAVTPRLEAGLRAIPLGVMLGIAAPVAATGRVPELLGLGVVVLAVRLTGSELVATVGGVTVLAFARAAGL